MSYTLKSLVKKSERIAKNQAKVDKRFMDEVIVALKEEHGLDFESGSSKSATLIKDWYNELCQVSGLKPKI